MENPTPPPLPLFQPPPAPVPSPPKKGIPGWLIALIVVIAGMVMLVVLATLATPMIKRAREKARQAQAEARRKISAKPLSAEEKEQARALAQKVLTAVESRDFDTLNSSVNYAAVTDIWLGELNMNRNAKESVQAGLRSNPGGLFANLLGQPGRFVRHHTRDGWPAVTVRFMPSGGGVSYVDLILERNETRGFQVIDLYTYLFGLKMSDETKRALAMMMKGGEPSVLSRILGVSGSADPSMFQSLEGMVESLKARQFADVIAKYEALPENLRKTPFMYVMYIQALQATGSEAANSKYVSALESAKKVLGEDVTIDLLLVDMHFLKGDMVAACQCVENSLHTIGDDSYQYFLLGLMRARLQDQLGAEDALRKAEEIEPEMNELIDLRMMIHALKKDYSGLVELMRDYSARTGAKLTPDVLHEAVYENFKQSPEFERWAEEVTK